MDLQKPMGLLKEIQSLMEIYYLRDSRKPKEKHLVIAMLMGFLMGFHYLMG